MDTIHKYRVEATSTQVRSGSISAPNIALGIAFSAPPEFNGFAGRWTPEHFLIAAVASCFVSTFSGMAANSNFEFASLELDAEGTLTQEQTGWRFQEIVLRPRLTIFHEKDQDRGTRLLHKAEKNCLIARSLVCPIILEPATVIAEHPAPVA